MGKEFKDGKVPLISKIAYGFGDVGCNFSWMFVSNFLMIFYTDVFGISMTAVSALMLFSRFWDAINDPIVGGLTDKTKTRWGRYRPWLLVAAPVTAILLMLTFWAHPDWSDKAKIIYMVITYCLLVLADNSCSLANSAFIALAVSFDSFAFLIRDVMIVLSKERSLYCFE